MESRLRVSRFPVLAAGLAAMFLALLVPQRSVRAADLRFEWQSRFADAEQPWLEGWIRETLGGLETLVGPLDLPLRVQIRRTAAREPVPWAQTMRALPQGVRFHVDPRFGAAAFRADWTAAHELSHLVLPYLDDDGAWFAEGFASVLQYPVMAAAGHIDPATARTRMRENVEQARADNPYADRPYLDAVGPLARRGYYSVMYWGGAAYFMQVDASLKARGKSLHGVLREYVACCRRNYDELDSLITQLDRLAGIPVFSAERERLRLEPGIPPLP